MDDQFNEKMKQGRKTLRVAFGLVLSVMFCLFLLDAALRIFVPKTGILKQSVDIQNSEMLHTRLSELRATGGLKIVVLGDSLVYGRTMRDHGDKDWQYHTLAAQLQRKLAGQLGACRVNVVNLGLDGLLPSDLYELLRNVMSAGADMIIFDLSLRSFSSDFKEADAQMSRPFLKTYSYESNGKFNTSFEMQWNAPGQIVHKALMNYWYLYSIKDYLQSTLFDGQPVDFMQRLRNYTNNWFIDDVNKYTTVGGDGELLLLFKARSRYRTINLDEVNPQVIALNNLLEILSKQEQPFISFYASENAQIRDQLFESKQFEALQAQLASIFKKHKVKNNWLGVMDIFEPDHYLDHVHLNKDGYKLLAHALSSKILERFEADLNFTDCR